MGICEAGNFSSSYFQVMLLNAVKDVASSLGNLIDNAKNSSGRGQGDGAGDDLKTAAKVWGRERKGGEREGCFCMVRV